MIKIKFSRGLADELGNLLTNMAGSPKTDPAYAKGIAARAAIVSKRAGALLTTSSVEVATTVLDELAWIGWQCDGYDPGQASMISAARRAHTKLAALIAQLNKES